MLKVFALEADRESQRTLTEALSKQYDIRFWTDGKTLLKELTKTHYDAVILNLKGNNEDTFDHLREIKANLPHTPVVITSESERAEVVVKAIKQGAYDYVVKPFYTARIQHVIQNALEHRGLKNEIDYLRREQDVVYNFNQIIAVSPSMKIVVNTLKKFAETDATILMTGETGTGKSFLSGTIHFNSNRNHKAFVKINCANIPETLLESELFGHEKGAFTGADKLRVGRFEQAHGGTMFLDEIGEISLSLQSKLLRVLEDKSFERIGGNKTIHSDVRVIAATNKNLEQLISEGKFREDLYYRINVLHAILPPLRERRQCIEPLAYALLNKICRSVGKRCVGFSPAVTDRINGYPWPGNIRQLANTIERATILEETDIIQESSISMPEPMGRADTQSVSASQPESLEMGEKELILKALEENLWIQKDAAKDLGVSPRTLNYKIKKFGISHPRWRKHK